MWTAGLDIGSRTIALVEWNGERVTRAEVVDTGADPLTRSRQLIAGRVYERINVIKISVASDSKQN